MTVISDINQTWPDAIVDIGPIELTVPAIIDKLTGVIDELVSPPILVGHSPVGPSSRCCWTGVTARSGW
jgi:hypothetical protein